MRSTEQILSISYSSTKFTLMQKLIILILLLTASESYSQTRRQDSVWVATNDVQSANEAFDDLDSCEYYSALKDKSIIGLAKSVNDRDKLIAEKEINFNLLASSKLDV